MPPEFCPNCGAEIPDDAKCCPECGSDENSGWSDAARSGRLGLPEEGFDYDEFVKKEFGTERTPRGMGWFWWGIAVVVLILFVFLVIR